jgi:hypothetical protein
MYKNNVCATMSCATSYFQVVDVTVFKVVHYEKYNNKNNINVLVHYCTWIG